MYEWAVGDGDEYGENGCAVLFDCLPEEAGPYVMCYYSYKLDCIISVSDPFEVKYMDIVVYLSEGSFSAFGIRLENFSNLDSPFVKSDLMLTRLEAI